MKVITRGAASNDERFRFTLDESSLKVIEMSEVPRPILSPGVKEVEWSAEVDNCPAVEKIHYLYYFTRIDSFFL